MRIYSLVGTLMVTGEQRNTEKIPCTSRQQDGSDTTGKSTFWITSSTRNTLTKSVVGNWQHCCCNLPHFRWRVILLAVVSVLIQYIFHCIAWNPVWLGMGIWPLQCSCHPEMYSRSKPVSDCTCLSSWLSYCYYLPPFITVSRKKSPNFSSHALD